METFLDYFMSSVMYMTLFAMVVIFVFIGLSFKNPFRSKTLNGAYKIFMYAVPFCMLMAPMFLYYGLSNEFSSIAIGKTTIVLFEEYERGNDGPSENVCRIHILNKETGVKTERMYAGSSDKLVGMKGDSLCYENYYSVSMYDTKNQEELWAISKDEWGKQFPELASGVEDISSNANYDNPRMPFINLSAKNGNKYWIEPFSKKLLTTAPRNIVKAGYYSRGYELKYQDTSGKTFTLVDEAYVEGSKRKKLIAPKDGFLKIVTNDNETFLETKFLGIDPTIHVYVFAHYTNTDKTDFTVEAKDFSSKTIWKKTFAELGATDSYSYGHELNVYAVENGILYFNVGGYVLAIEMKSGSVKWKTRL